MTDDRTIRGAGMMVLGPVIGLFYAVLFPFIGIAAVITLGIEKALGAGLADNASFGWRPGESYLSGKKKK